MFFQFFKAFADLRWVGFVGFCVGLVKLIQDGLAIGIAQIKRVLVHVKSHTLGDIIHNTPPPVLLVRPSAWRCSRSWYGGYSRKTVARPVSSTESFLAHQYFFITLASNGGFLT